MIQNRRHNVEVTAVATERQCCPRCESAAIETCVSRGYLRDTDHDWRCKDCGHPFDDPNTRTVDNVGRGAEAVLRAAGFEGHAQEVSE